MKRDVGSLMRTLIRDQEAKEAKRALLPEARGELTTLGVPLTSRDPRHFVIDLTGIRIFRHLHTFVQLLINEVLEQCGFGVADIMVRRKVDPNLTPELAAAGLDWVMVYARVDAAEGFPFYHRHFGNCMQVLFRTLQTEKWGGMLFPEFFGLREEGSGGRGGAPPAHGPKAVSSHSGYDEIREEGAGDAPPALLFPFHLQEREEAEGGHYFLVEYSKSGRFLRITIEDAATSRLQLKHIPHRVVDQFVRRSYLPDVHGIAEQIHQGVLQECNNNRTEYQVMEAHQRELFDHLRRGGLPDLRTLRFGWPTDDIQLLLMEQRQAQGGPGDSLAILVKEVQVLEDPLILACLAKGSVVEMVSGPFSVFFDLSRYGACLNISFDERRAVLALGDYLAWMPALERAAGERRGALGGVRLFLIHHITSEVIGLLKAFEEAGCNALTTFFVKYAGIIPESYLETLMSLPREIFRFCALQKIESRQSLAGRYALSRQFTPLGELGRIDEAIFAEGLSLFEALRLAAGHLFLQEAMAARKNAEQLLLVEDGGYLAPLLNRFCLENRTVREVFAHFRLDPPSGDEGLPMAFWLRDLFPGSVEHTRNGYDFNLEVTEEFGRLQFPVASIAVSKLKRGPEARECAVAILNATENILHRLGMLLSRRRVLVLGSCGAIGGYLKQELLHRVEAGHLFGVDIALSGGREGSDRPPVVETATPDRSLVMEAATPDRSPVVEAATPDSPPVVETATLDGLGPEALAEVDLMIGVIGRSILHERQIEDLLLHSRRKVLLFVSGSTKTVEFSDLERFLQRLRDDADPKLAGQPVRIAFAALRDLQTGILQGYRVDVTFPEDAAKDKTLYLLGELMPINFLYYGIPGEIVDEVMAQLFTLSCGLVRRQRSSDRPEPRLLAVDHEIDADANALSAR